MPSMTSWLVVMVATIAAVAIRGGDSISMSSMAKDIEATEHIVIRHVTPDHIRRRRSSDGHPMELHFDLHHDDHRVSKLRLKRMADDSADADSETSGPMRVYRVVNDRLREVPETSSNEGVPVDQQPPSRQNDVGFFTDEDRLSLFRVRSTRSRLQAYDLVTCTNTLTISVAAYNQVLSFTSESSEEGTVIMNDREYIVSPNNEYLAVNESERAHRLCRLMKHLNYGLDALHDGDRNQNPSDRYQTRRRISSRRFPVYAKPYRGPRRKKRQAEMSTNFVEVVFYCDFSCYNQFESNSQRVRTTNDSVYATIRNHFTFIAKAMNLRYESITYNIPDQQILISAQNLVVLDRADLSEFTERNQAGGLVDARDAIISFRSYIRGGNGVPRADHWMLFTAYDLSVNDNTNTIGIAYLNRICSDSSVSVIEEFFSGTTAQIATHELGHILGAEHDSAYGQCTDNNYNIMAGVAFFPEQGEKVQNPWRFSACSSQVITDFISGPSGSCLRNRPSRIVTSPEEAGQTFNADAQCQLSQGPDSFFCRGVQKERGLDKMCVRMYCFLPDESPNCNGLIALDGTSCGDGKWCQRGRCLRNEMAPRIQNGDACPQGDDPFYGCSQNSCNDTDARFTFCCKTCGEGRTQRPVKPSPQPQAIPPPEIAVPPIPVLTRAPAIVSIDQVLPPAPPPPPSRQLNPRPQFVPGRFRRPVVVRRPPAPPPTTTRRPIPRRPQAPWWRIPAPPPQRSQGVPRSQQQGVPRFGGDQSWQCNTDICRCLTRSNSFATCLYRSWFTGR